MPKNWKQIIIAVSIVSFAGNGIALLRRNLANEIVAAGDFHQVAHKARGRAEIIKRRSGEYSLKLWNFETTAKPDLFVYLISAPDAFENEAVKTSDVLELGSLKNTKGDQEYLLPQKYDPAKYRAVTIWNRRHQVNFTTAPLKEH